MERLLKFFYHLCRLLLGATFAYAGWIKMQDVTGFAGEIAAYQILPYQWNFLVAASLPYVEFVAGVLLLINRRVRPAALLLALLLLVFLGALGSVIARGLEIDCGCFGEVAASQSTAFWRDLVLLTLAHFTFHLRNKFAGSMPAGSGSSD